jgi:rod shape-determining protein MreC
VREGEEGTLHTIQLGASEVLRPVRGAFELAVSPFEAARERVGMLLSGSDTQALQQKARENEEGAAEASRLRDENERLRKLLDSQESSFKYAPLAQVTSPVGNQFTERVQINQGSDDGVAPEQPVVVGNNTLVGRTTNNVTPHTAEVLLVTDPSFAAGVRLLPPPKGSGNEETTSAGTTTSAETTGGGSTSSSSSSHGEGLLRTGWEGYLGVDFVDLDSGAQQGDFVVTSGRAGSKELLFPPGLLIGTVESVSSQDIDQYMKIVVTPAVKPNDLSDVRVITSW